MCPEPVNLESALRDFRSQRPVLVVLLWTTLALTLVEYLFLAGSAAHHFPQLSQSLSPGVLAGSWSAVSPGTTAPWWGVLFPWAWWTFGMLLLWVLVPWCISRGQRFTATQIGLGFSNTLRKLPVYLLLLALVAPAVWWASSRDSFVGTYPFLRPQYCQQWCWAVLLGYWAIYAVQFFCVEFFFRGWLLFSLEPRLGLAAIPVMVVPYTMIHFHKPLPEALGAIVAGTVLGWMALRTRSIWGGVFVHVCVALGMDALSLWRGGSFPNQFLP
ncbi:MAG: CPBP family intramembrane metalloprotease [Planctomycetes bacterium]|nr:CPBP family intramembrane metalloprotease [Planctomycetota bacterium]